MEGVSICDCNAATISGTLRTSLYAPDQDTILNTHWKFMKTGSVMDRPRPGRLQSGQSEQNVAAVREAFDLSQGKSI